MPPAQISQLEDVFGSIVRIAISGAGIAVLVMIVVGGFKYLSAGDDKDAAEKARRTLTYAIGGLIVVLCAWIILSFLGTILGVDFGTFSLSI